MNVLILQGSPRANGNTAWMAEEYRKAAEAAGHKATLVDVAHRKIAGCLACEHCHGKGNGSCVQKDDMQALYPLLAEAEALGADAPFHKLIALPVREKIGRLKYVTEAEAPAAYEQIMQEMGDQIGALVEGGLN